MRAYTGLAPPARVIGRYALYGEIASGGMASVYFGRLLGEAGFSRTVAVKRLHPQFAKDPEFVSMFLNEARLAARIRHPNVVSTLDIVSTEDDLSLVMEFVQGESLSKLVRAVRMRGERIPPPIACAIVANALHGLHAAHEATTEWGEPLHIVHRDVSPQNILVGIDGVARVLDFGVAKAAVSATSTREGQLKGKLAYMAPEQIKGTVDRRTDIYAASVVLWEALTGKRLFSGESEGAIYHKVVNEDAPPPTAVVPELPPELDALTLCGLSRDKERRFASAREMALALEAYAFATPSEVAAWVEAVAGELLAKRARQIAEIESLSSRELPAAPPSAPISRRLRHDTSESQISAFSSMATSHPAGAMPPTDDADANAPWMWAGVAVMGALTVVGAIVLAFFVGHRTRASAAPPPAEATSIAAATALPPSVAPSADQPPPLATPTPTPTPIPSAPSARPSASAPVPVARPPSAPAAKAASPKAPAPHKSSDLEDLIDSRK